MVTLVIEDEQGQRVRNLVSETPYPAGDNVAWWDGSDDLLRDVDAARHGLYHIPDAVRGTGQIHGARTVAQAAAVCCSSKASTPPATRPGKPPTRPAAG